MLLLFVALAAGGHVKDQFSDHYQDLLAGSYDCVDRIVLNAYFPMGVSAAGFRYWWRLLYGSDANLDKAHLTRLASRFSRRLRAWAKAHQVPVVDCSAGERKHEIAAQYLLTHEVHAGLFMVLVSRAPALVWDVQMSAAGKIGNIERKKPRPWVNHYSFHILDPEWGHVTIKMSGHPPFGAQVILNGHEYVACQARKRGIEFTKNGNCFTDTADAGGLARVADTLSHQRTIGRLSQLCERWIYSSCLLFALHLEEQKRSGFRYEYSVYQLEYSRNLQFWKGGQMEQVLQSLIDRTRVRLGLRRVQTIFGSKKRPCRRKLQEGRYGVVVETPAYDLTVFKVHYGKLTLKIYSKGESVLRTEAVVHNAKELRCGLLLGNFPRMVELLRGMLERFLNTLHWLNVCFIADDTLEGLGSASRVGKTNVGGVDFNRPRMRALVRAVIVLASSPKGFTASEVAREVRQLKGAEASSYEPRKAAYDLKKLRGKSLVEKIGSSHRYQATRKGLRAMAALVILRDKVIQPLLANSCQLKRGPKPNNATALDQHYERLQVGMQGLFAEIGIAA